MTVIDRECPITPDGRVKHYMKRDPETGLAVCQDCGHEREWGLVLYGQVDR